MRLAPALVASLLAAVVVADVVAVALHDDATPYGAKEAVADFRKGAGAGPSPRAAPGATPTPRPSGVLSPVATPAAADSPQVSGAPSATVPRPSANPASERPDVSPGVYRYATSGHEEVDVLGGSRHDYPDETLVTYRRGGCGIEDRWQPLKERYSENVTCRGPAGLEARRSVQRREFYGQAEEQVLVCTPGLVLVPADPRPGRTSSGSCRSDDTSVALTSRVKEVTTLTVDGRSVEVVHVRLDGRLTGSTRGTTEREVWFTRAGLLVRVSATTESDRDTSAGTVHYTETYDLRLLSLEPQR